MVVEWRPFEYINDGDGDGDGEGLGDDGNGDDGDDAVGKSDMSAESVPHVHCSPTLSC